MSNSPLVTVTQISPNRTSPRNHKIDTITIHCYVGNIKATNMLRYLGQPSTKASANYVIGKNGEIGLCVPENDRSWCSSNADNDHRAITIECASETTSPYEINDKVFNSLINLLVDICKRNNIDSLKWKGDKKLIGKVDQQNMTVHRWFAAKACPGDYIYSRLGQIAELVNVKLGHPNVTDTPFRVKVDISDLRIRTGAGTNYKSNGYTGRGVFTIVEVKNGPGSGLGWGKLKSGAGWISLDYAKRL